MIVQRQYQRGHGTVVPHPTHWLHAADKEFDALKKTVYNTANHHAVGGSKDSTKPRSLAAAAVAKTREPFRCPKCSVEVRGKMKCEMGC
jgi:hypothetical protein